MGADPLDLVMRLRCKAAIGTGDCCDDLMTEAADEIQRLNKVNAQLLEACEISLFTIVGGEDYRVIQRAIDNDSRS
jgi:hypothetical protein